MKSYIFIGGGVDKASLESPIQENALVIAADSGYDNAKALGYAERCDFIVGDFDSTKEKVFCSRAKIIRVPSEKDETDTYLAFLEGYRRGYRDFVLLGCTGGRADHTYANYQLLYTIKKRCANALLLDDKNAVFCIESEAVELSANIGTRVSIFALSNEAVGVTLEGLLYPLANGTLNADFPLGVSNETASERTRLEVKRGALLVFTEPSARVRYL